jgi:hypothetical protein
MEVSNARLWNNKLRYSKASGMRSWVGVRGLLMKGRRILIFVEQPKEMMMVAKIRYLVTAKAM